MKILIINSEYPPIGAGAGNASANIARLLSSSGHEVVVLTSWYDGLPREENLAGVQIVRAPALRQKIDQSSALEQLSFIFGGFLAAANLRRGFSPNVTLAFFGIPSGAVAWGLKMLWGIPYIVSLRGGDVPGFRPYDFKVYHRLMAPFLRVIWRHSSALVANSCGLQKLALQFSPKANIQIIPNGVDLEKFSPVSQPGGTVDILFVGRLVYQKGLDLALQALSDLVDLPWTFTIAGAGPQQQALERLVVSLNLSDRVVFCGWQSPDDLIVRYRQANLFLFPSRHEGMPNAVLEAMASGLPVVATQIAGNEELIVHAETGLLVPAEDAESLRDALASLLSEKESLPRMGAAARRRVEQFFSWQVATDQYIQLLKKAQGA